MIIRLNGSNININASATLLSIIQEKGLLPERIVVEYNKEIISRDKYGEVVIKDNDSIEIVSFVGGG